MCLLSWQISGTVFTSQHNTTVSHSILAAELIESCLQVNFFILTAFIKKFAFYMTKYFVINSY